MSTEKWKAVNSKKHRNSGQQYVSKRGQVLPAKVFKKYECKCKFTECSKLSEEELELSFQKFWEIGDYNLQNAFLSQQIISYNKKLTREQNPDKTSKPRLKSRNYFIVGKKVCNGLFVQTFGINNGRLSRLLQKHDLEPYNTPTDERWTSYPSNRSLNDVQEVLCKTLANMPKYISNHGRSIHKSDIYLTPDVTFENLYDLLKQEIEADGIGLPSQTWFRNAMNKNTHTSKFTTHSKTNVTNVKSFIFLVKRMNCFSIK